jgi:2-hydroxychromene-2-carboxylate isomerase
MSSDAVLHAVIAEAGYDADAVMAKANSQEIKQDLRTRTKEAKDTGICGVPSYRIFRRKIGQGEQDWKLASDIVWGQDETVVVEDLISGWDGQGRALGLAGNTESRPSQSKL